MRIALFLEDAAHLTFIGRLVGRTVEELGAVAEIVERNAVGGSGTVLRSLQGYVRDLALGRADYADILVVAIDGNRRGPRGRIRDIREVCNRAGYAGRLVCAVPDPHIEIWYLADGRAVGRVTGTGRQEQLPARSRERDLYKRLLLQSFRDADIDPPLGGAEYGVEIADALDLDAAGRGQESLQDFLASLRSAIHDAMRP